MKKLGRKVEVFFFRIFIFFSLRLRLYYWWSRRYQFAFEWRYENEVLPELSGFADLENVLSRMRWRKDTEVMLYDAISTPQATYARHRMGYEAGDCDDISIYAVNRINDMRSRDLFRGNVYEVGLLSVPWIDEDDEIGGHNVCAFSYNSKLTDGTTDYGVIRWAYVSNWFNGRIRYGFKSIEDVVREILRFKSAQSIGWAWATEKLEVIKYHNGEGFDERH